MDYSTLYTLYNSKCKNYEHSGYVDLNTSQPYFYNPPTDPQNTNTSVFIMSHQNYAIFHTHPDNISGMCLPYSPPSCTDLVSILDLCFYSDQTRPKYELVLTTEGVYKIDIDPDIGNQFLNTYRVSLQNRFKIYDYIKNNTIFHTIQDLYDGIINIQQYVDRVYELTGLSVKLYTWDVLQNNPGIRL